MADVTLSDPLDVNLIIYRGDSGRFRISVSDEDGPVDVSDATWKAEIRSKVNDTTILTEFDIELVSGDTSAIDVVLSADKSEMLNGSAVWDIQMTRGTNVLTLMAGSISVTKDVTRP